MLRETRSLLGFVKIRLFAVLICTALLLTGCGGKSGSGNSTPTPTTTLAVAITAQPVSQTVPIAEWATFTVTAYGTAPLSYQWSENGAEIAGATNASYTTPAIALGESGSTAIGTFQVTVSNSAGSVTSNTATLTAGPRSPKAGDLRYLFFQQVDRPGLLDEGTTGGVTVSPGGIDSAWVDNAVGSPLGIGSSFVCGGGTCVWPFSYQLLPSPMTGLNMYYQGGNYSSFTSDLQSFAASNVVFTSLDLEPAENAYAVSWVQATQIVGFDYRQDPIIPAGMGQQAQIQAQAMLDGTESRVITAVSFDQSGNANMISYGWQGDTTTAYETQTVIAAPADVENQATILAGDGYIISAFGGNDTNGYMLIGTRVVGDSLPRPINVFTSTGNVLAPAPDSAYFTTVVYLREPSGFTIVNEQ